MKRLAILLLLAGCMQKIPASSKLAQFTEADLTNAIALAQASTQPQAPLIVTCFTFLKTQLAALQSPTTSGTGTVGVATAFVVADLAAGGLSSALTPGAQAAYAAACGPLVIYTQNQGLTLGAQIAALGAVITPKL